MVTASRFRALALSFDGAFEVPHMERAAFRTKRRIFVTLAPDGASANLMLDPDLQEAICHALPRAFEPVPGGWGRMGATTVDLAVVGERDLLAALTEAHGRASGPTAAKRAALAIKPTKMTKMTKTTAKTPRTVERVETAKTAKAVKTKASASVGAKRPARP